MKNIVSCPAKILLAGGYAILNPANHGLSIAIDARFYSIMRKYKSDQHQLKVLSPQFNQQYLYDLHKYGQNENNNKFLDGVVTILRRNPDLHDVNYSYELTLMADNAYYGQTDKAIGKKSGLGSSAGVIVSSLAQFTRDKEKLLELSKQANFLAQNKVGSGFDLSTAIFGSQLFSQQTIKPIVLPAGMQIILVDLQQGSNTVQGVNTVQKYLSHNDSVYRRFLQESEETVQNLQSLLLKQNIDKLELKKVNEQYRELLREIGNQSNFHIEPQIASTILDFISKLDCTLWSICPGAGGYDAIAFLVKDITETQVSIILYFIVK